MSNYIVGIDLGTSNSKVGVFKDGSVIIVPNSIGDPFTPSVVAILDEGEAIGEEIIMNNVDEKQTITEIKRLVGKNINDLKDFKRINYNICGNNDNLQIKVIRKGKEVFYSPEEIIGLILKKLIKTASNFMGVPISKAIIAVPLYYDDKQKNVIKESAKKVGIEVLELIKEPIAAAMAYEFGTKSNLKDSLAPSFMKQEKKNEKILVFDLGGATLDISILVLENNEFIVKSNVDDPFLGGIDFDNKLFDYCINDFCQKMNVNENDIRKDHNCLKRLRTQCEKAKKKLSKSNSVTINVFNFFQGFDLYIEMNRDRFNEESEDLYQKIENLLDKVLKDSSFTGDEIDHVIMVGGSSNIPKIRIILETKFNANKIKDKINQDEVIAFGAALKAYKLSKNIKGSKILENLPFSLGVGVYSKNPEEIKNGQLMSKLLDKNSKLPVKSIVKTYKTMKDNQPFFKIKIYSGEEKYVKNNQLLGIFKLEDLPPGKAKTVSFTLFLEVDIYGILTVNAEVVGDNGKKVIEQYSIYDKNKISNRINQTTIIKLKTNPKSREKYNEIKNIVKAINEKNEALNYAQNDDDKINILKELSESCSKIINIFETLKKENDSHNSDEKIFNYTKLLFNYYSKILIIDKENNISSDIINKIKEEMNKFMNDNIEDLINCFNDLKTENPIKYVEIILFCVEILYKEGDRILEERKQYARYYSKKFYQKAENIKKYIDDNLKKEMDYKLTTKYNDIEKNYGTKVSEIDAFVKIIKEQVEKKNTPYLPNKTGFTSIGKILSKSDDTYFIVDIFQEMADSLSKGPVSEAEAYCRANIIKINFSVFKNYDFKLYQRLNKRIEFIYDRLDIDDDEEPDWHKQLVELNAKIEEKQEEIENEKIKENENNKNIINDINNLFENKMRENAPMEFIEFILDNYPFKSKAPYKKEELKQKDFKEVFQIIFPNYHPDNYKDDKTYSIYHEIYILLVKIEDRYFKNK